MEDGYVWTSFLVNSMDSGVLKACIGGADVYAILGNTVIRGKPRLSSDRTWYAVVDEAGIVRSFCNFFVKVEVDNVGGNVKQVDTGN